MIFFDSPVWSIFGEGKTPNLHEATVMPAEATAAGGSSYGNGAWSLEELKEISSSGNSSSSNNNSKKLSTPLQWKILSESGGRVIKIIDTTNCKKSNWLKFVRMAKSRSEQNLIACQIENDIFFYTIKSIVPNSELLFWYSKEYAQKVQMPTSCEFWKNLLTLPTARPRVSEPSMPNASYAPTAKHSQAALPDEAIDYSMKTKALKISTTTTTSKTKDNNKQKEDEHENDEEEEEEHQLVVDDTTDDDERKSKATTVSPKGDNNVSTISPNLISSNASATSEITSFSSDESSTSHSPTSQTSSSEPQIASTAATATAAATIQRPNVIQNPVHRPIPLKQSAQSAFSLCPPTSATVPQPQQQQQQQLQQPSLPVNTDTIGPFLRHASQLNLNNLLDYWRRAVFSEPPPQHPTGSRGGPHHPSTANPVGGLWMQPGMPQIGSTPGNSRHPQPPSIYGGRAPMDESPLSAFAATAGSHGFPPHGYTQLYAAAAAAAVAKQQQQHHHHQQQQQQTATITDLSTQTQNAFFGTAANPGHYPYPLPSQQQHQPSLASVAAAA
uniref:SET domain-containing protein n=1 Tax=Panagrolaimus sp. PS1159 TaxID=55785 RepID=A0AC35GW04_9BILA